MSSERAAAERIRVVLTLTLIQMLFGVHYLAGKILLKEIPPRAWAVIRVVAAAAVLLAVARAMGRRFPRAPRDLALLALFSVFGVAINQVCFVEGLSRTTAIHSAIINSLMPAWTLFFAVMLGREALTAAEGALAGAGGGRRAPGHPPRDGVVHVRDVRRGHDHDDQLDVLLVLPRSISKRTMHRVDALAATALMFVFGAVPIALFGGSALARLDFGAVSTAAWLWGAFIILLPTAGAYVLISWTLARAEASLVALFIYLQPVIAAVLGIVFQGEILTIRTVLGGLLIFAGVYFASISLVHPDCAAPPRVLGDTRLTPKVGPMLHGTDARSIPRDRFAEPPLAEEPLAFAVEHRFDFGWKRGVSLVSQGDADEKLGADGKRGLVDVELRRVVRRDDLLRDVPGADERERAGLRAEEVGEVLRRRHGLGSTTLPEPTISAACRRTRSTAAGSFTTAGNPGVSV